MRPRWPRGALSSRTLRRLLPFPVLTRARAGPCIGGYYCSRASPIAAPGSLSSIEARWVSELGFYGAICTAGGYCPAGSFTPSLCPPGTYLNTSGQTGPEGCRTCIPGYYCGTSASPGPSGALPPGVRWRCTAERPSLVGPPRPPQARATPATTAPPTRRRPSSSSRPTAARSRFATTVNPSLNCSLDLRG